MPTYEYACAKCGHEFEVFQSMKDAPLASRCPACKKGKVKRKIGGGGGLIFKGSGFYETDYKRKSPIKGGGGGSESSTPATKSDTKPAATPKPSSTPSS